jgi:hypothetical protein
MMRKKQREKPSNTGMWIALGGVGCFVVVLVLAGGVVGVLFATGVIGSKKSTEVVQKTDRGDPGGKSENDRGGSPTSDPKLVTNAAFNKLPEKGPVTLVQAQQTFGGSGRLLSAGDFDAACQKSPIVNSVRDLAAGCKVYQWDGNAGNVYLFFAQDGQWRGGIFQPSEKGPPDNTKKDNTAYSDPKLVNKGNFNKITAQVGLTLALAQKTFGGPGRALTPPEYEAACKQYNTLNNLRNQAAGCTVYQWDGNTGIAFLFFAPDGQWRGGMFENFNKGKG